MADVTSKVAQIRAAVLGLDVRENIALGIEAINAEAVSTTALQVALQTIFAALIINAGSSNAEVVAARGSAADLPTRLSGVDAQLAESATKVEVRMKAVPLEQSDLSTTLQGQMLTNTIPLNEVPAINSLIGKQFKGWQSGKNRFNKNDITVDTYCDSSNGTVYGQVGDNSSGFIPILPGEILHRSVAQVYAFFLDEVFVSGGNSGNVFTVPTGVNSVRVTVPTTSLDTFQLELGEIETTYEPYKIVLDFASTGIEFIPLASSGFPLSKWVGKKWYVIGDSITEHNFRTVKNYHDYITDKIGCIVTNYGIGGTGYTGPATYEIYNRIAGLGTDADLITVMAGVNDFAFASPPILGQLGDAPGASFYGAVESTVQQLIAKFPTKTIALITSTPYSTPWSVNSQGYSQQDLANAVVKVGEHYSIPVLDLNKCSNLAPWNDASNEQYFHAIGEAEGDRLHPNDAGHMVMADKILSFLNTL